MKATVNTNFNFSMDNGTLLRLFLLMVGVFVMWHIIAKIATKI
jgi:hypothetical protein